LQVKDAIKKAIEEIEILGLGKGKTNFRLRDAIFGRQRYWGEPIPVYYKNNIPYVLSNEELPLELPKIDSYLPTTTGEPPLGRAKDWKYKGEFEYELSTMPGWAGSSWYFLRYMDNKNNTEFVSKQAAEYWQQVDLYLGGSEHATGHLLYVRFWSKFLYDLGLIPCDEPAKKLINQGMITGRSSFVYRIKDTNKFVSMNLKNDFETFPLNVDVNFVKNDVLDIDVFKNWREDYNNAEFIFEDGKYICGSEIEKMSKSKYNVVTPDDIVEDYGADTLRLYEMFLGPLEQSKPWNTNGIEGVHRFLKKLWRLFYNNEGTFMVNQDEPTKAEFKALHKTIKKVADDIENFSFNTSVSNFMICVNELTDLKCYKQAILQDLLVVLSPYAPHIAEELWHQLGNITSITKASFPAFNAEYLLEDEFSYPISINGKHRMNLTFSLQATAQEIEAEVLAHEAIQKWLEGKAPKKVIFVKGKIVNLVC
jgi:leucyl-tRNA synthetase